MADAVAIIVSLLNAAHYLPAGRSIETCDVPMYRQHSHIDFVGHRVVMCSAAL